MTMDMAYLRQLHSVSQKPFTESHAAPSWMKMCRNIVTDDKGRLAISMYHV
jgi:hypothetical protein